MFYRIGEVSELTEVDAATLRYWEKEFPTLRPKKNKAGQRIYSKRDVELILRIRKLLHDDGYTVSGARKKLSSPAGEAGKAPEGSSPGADSQRANRLHRARQLAREILEILDSRKISE